MAGEEIAMRDQDKEKIDDAIEQAEECFWMAIIGAYPEIKTGDVNPLTDGEFKKAMRAAVTSWLELNTPKPVETASCELVVEMRPPKRGELGVWKKALSNTASEALRDVLAAIDDEEGPWRASEDRTDANAVTVILRPNPLQATPLAELWTASYKRDWGAFVPGLPEHDGWKAFWEYPGFIAWRNAACPDVTVYSTPDWSMPGEIAVDAQTTDGRRPSKSELNAPIPWPPTVRSHDTFMERIRPRLDAIKAAAAARIRCPHCNCTDLDQLSVTETFVGYHHILPGKDADGNTMLENALTASGPPHERFDDGAGDFKVSCNACGQDSSVIDAGLGTSLKWQWV